MKARKQRNIIGFFAAIFCVNMIVSLVYHNSFWGILWALVTIALSIKMWSMNKQIIYEDSQPIDIR